MIEIIKCMPGCTVQDAGRTGYRRLGVGSSGALDQLALAAGNILLGNKAEAASLEILLFPLEIRFLKDCAFAVTGSPNKVSLDDSLLPPWWRASAKAGQTLRIEGTAKGGVNYLSLGGGLDVALVMASASTDLKGQFGGHDGRMLKAGDIIRGIGQAGPVNTASFGACPFVSAEPDTLRVLPGFELERLTTEQRSTLWNSTWTVSRQSNRIGFRLEGPALVFDTPIELLSYGFMPGLIQLPPSGQPIVMLSDAQTSGGYPRLGSVIESDLRLLAQSSPGSRLRLRICSLEEALEAETQELAYKQRLQSLREAVCP